MEKITIPYKQHYIQADFYGDFSDLNKITLLMAHGLGGEKQCGLADFAESYHALGLNVCVFDHRGFGESTGSVKCLVDKTSQLEDWQSVIHYLKDELNISTKNMILWGYSFSGGHVMTLASETTFKAVISNFPHVDGLASLTLYPKKYLVPATLIALQDLALAPFGKIKTMPVVAQDRFAILAGEDCYEGYHSIIPESVQWENAVPARIVATIGLYRPTTIASKINSPTLIVGAQNDSLIPIKATRKAARRIPNVQYEEFECGHFDLFHEPFKSQILEKHSNFIRSILSNQHH